MFREARSDDVVALTELERDANRASLAHIFPPEQYPFPFDALLARWQLVLDDPAAAVLVLDDREHPRLAAYIAYGDEMVRHVGVRPERWGEGIATAGLRRAARDMACAGATRASLWVLTENHRARRLYEHLGWRSTSEVRDAPWPPYPEERRYVLELAPR